MKKGENILISNVEYVLIKFLGDGGSGTVWKVKSNEQEYAIKFIQSNNAEKIKRFKKEINYCKANHHKNIIRVIAEGEYNSQPCYAMPVYSETLRDIIKKEN